LAYSIQAKSLKLLKDAGLPKELLESLKTLKGQSYETELELLSALKGCD
jgi:hypothetical protein